MFFFWVESFPTVSSLFCHTLRRFLFLPDGYYLQWGAGHFSNLAASFIVRPSEELRFQTSVPAQRRGKPLWALKRCRLHGSAPAIRWLSASPLLSGSLSAAAACPAGARSRGSGGAGGVPAGKASGEVGWGRRTRGTAQHGLGGGSIRQGWHHGGPLPEPPRLRG